jgi:hypothetical protein
VASPEALTRVFLLLLYLPLCLIAFRWLIPRLPRQSKQLAALFLLAQALVIAVSVEKQHAAGFEFWLWHLNREWNIPSTLASMQMALAGAAALLAFALAKGSRLKERGYLLAVGLLFLYLAHDEYANLHEFFPDWERLFAALGAIVVFATFVVARRAARGARYWHGCFLAGIAISGFGAVAFEAEPQVCELWGVMFEQPCFEMFFLEEPLEFAGIWLVLVALFGQLSLVAPMPSWRVRLALYAWPLVWLLILFQSRAILPITLQAVSSPAAVDFESDIRLHSYRIERDKESVSNHLFLSARSWDEGGVGYSIHLVDQASGESITSQDTDLHKNLEFLLAPGYRPVYRQWSKLRFPPDAGANRALWVVLSLWRNEGDSFAPLKIRSSDLRLLDDAQVILDEFAIQAEPRATTISPAAVFDNGFALEAFSMPGKLMAGRTAEVSFVWRSDAQGTADLAQFLHFVHQDSGAQWGYDQEPLGARMPTRLWYSGLADSETWRVPFPASLSSGEYQVFTGLYRISDIMRVPASDARGMSFADARVPLGIILVE